MKRFVLYSLIFLVSLVGFFGLRSEIRADDVLGTCTINYLSLSEPTRIPNVSEARCKTGDIFQQYKSNIDFSGTSWVRSATSPITPNPSPTTPTPNPATPGNPTTTTPSGNNSALGTCSIVFTSNLAPEIVDRSATETKCKVDLFERYNRTADFERMSWVANPPEEPKPADDTTPLERFVKKSCSVSLNGITQGCFLYIAYYIFYTIPAWLLYIAAMLFNALISIGLSTNLYTESTFISTAWAVVRDLSNIFFILILLYVAVETILGIGHNTKKTIAQVLLMALLINFSMFFTKVIIDTSNVVALVFYNRIDVSTKVNDTPQPYQEGSSNSNEKNISGGLTKAFDPTQLISEKFFSAAQQTIVDGEVIEFDEVPFGIVFGVTLLAGAIMAVAAYAFLVSGMAFLGRLIELWALIIFSPFAFMSSTVHKLAGTEYIGWNQWLSRLLKVSFMAPIFMFFMYLIFMLVQSNIFGTFLSQTQSKAQILLSVIIPALIIIKLLLKATSMAKSSAGEAGEFVMGAAKGIAGLAVGGAALGVAGGAMIGRQGGKFLASTSRTEDAVKYGSVYRKAQTEFSHELEEWERTGKKAGKKKPTWEEHWELEKATNPDRSIANAGFLTRVGGRINAAQQKKQEVSHAIHEMEELRGKVGAKDAASITGFQKAAMRSEFDKANLDKVMGHILRGINDKKEEVRITIPDPTDPTGKKTISVVGKNGYDKVMRKHESDAIMAAGDPGDVIRDASGRVTGLSSQGNRRVDSALGEKFTILQRDKAKEILTKKYHHLEAEERERVSGGEKLIGASASGSYDPRGLALLKGGMLDSVRNKAFLGIMGAVALGIRNGFKKTSGGFDGGAPKKDIVLDFKDILGGSLANFGKNLNVKVDLGGGGGHGGGHDDHGGGHDDHGHGGGGHH